MQRRPKIIVAAHLPPSQGGPASLLENIFASTIANDFTLIPFNIGRPPKLNVTDNFGYQALFNAGLKRTLEAVLITLKHLIQFPVMLWRLKPAIVHIHTAPYWVFWETAFYVIACKIARVPCALQMHFSFRYFCDRSHPILQRLMLRIVRCASVFVVICKDDIQYLREIGVSDTALFYLPNFVNVKHIQEQIKKAPKTKQRKEFVEVLFLGGSDNLRKGLKELLKAVPVLVERIQNLRFRLVAVPADLVGSLVGDIYLEHCDVEKWLPHDKKFTVLANADIFVLPSHAEGMPMAILEAMACFLPIVSTNVAGIQDMIRHAQEGLLVSPGDVPALADSIARLAESAILRKELGSSAAVRVITDYDVSVGVTNLTRLYSMLLQGGKSIDLVNQ